MEDLKFDFKKNYQEIGLIGAGSYGIVSVYKDIQNNAHVAVKELQHCKTDFALKSILRELKILRMADHENIIPILRAFRSQQNGEEPKLFLILKYYPFDLRQILNLRNQNKLDLNASIKLIIYQIIRGIQYLHSGNVLHRDLKPENILINHENSQVAICDFGFARFRNEGDFDLTTDVTTRPYRAPELVFGQVTYSKEVDIWSIGCIFYELLSRKRAFSYKNHGEHIQQFVKFFGTPEPSYWVHIGTSKFKEFTYSFGVWPIAKISKTIEQQSDTLALDLLDSLLQFHPQKRISALEAMKHPYFQEIFHAEHLQNFETKPSDFEFETHNPVELNFLNTSIEQEIAELDKASKKINV